ncbi:MAG: HAD family phosphatase [Chitinophagaceae bacterium]|nr:HAD family phosphatase [Rubrivivax sp.]
MIEAVIFDLDGTLVETEEIKARSYARAAVLLRPELAEEAVYAAFTDLVGLSRREVALALVERFMLQEAAQARMGEFGVATPWQAYVQVRLNIYDQLLFDPAVLRAAQWPHNIALLHAVRQQGRTTALATMSYCAQVQRVLNVLDLNDAFHFVASRDDVENGKPDPEIYLLVARELGIAPGECLVIEDSPTGVQAGLAAGMNVIAVTTPLTRQKFRDKELLSRCWVVDDPNTLPEVVRSRITLHEQEVHTDT